jgi:putative membrane protein
MKSVIFAAMLSVLATSALAQSNTTAPAAGMQGQQAQKVSPATQQFVQKVAISDMFEIQSGQLAQQKATNDDYRQFGQLVENDHTKTSDEIKSIAQNIPGLQVPQALDNAHKKMLDKLQALDGAQFEDQFKKDQVAGHQEAIKLFQNYANKGDQADLKKFAQDTLPTLKMHLQHAQALPKGGAATTMGSAPSGSPKPRR